MMFLYMLVSLVYSTPVTNSIATYYFRVGDNVDGCLPVQNFGESLSYGSCGLVYSSVSKYWAAIANGANHCGETIIVSYKGRTIKLTVQDSCPGCEGDNHVDMGLEALIELTGSKEEACAINTVLPQITWEFEGTTNQQPQSQPQSQSQPQPQPQAQSQSQAQSDEVEYKSSGDDKMCQTNGFMKCCNDDFLICDHNKWVKQQCAAGTACKQNGNYIICDHISM